MRGGSSPGSASPTRSIRHHRSLAVDEDGVPLLSAGHCSLVRWLGRGTRRPPASTSGVRRRPLASATVDACRPSLKRSHLSGVIPGRRLAKRRLVEGTTGSKPSSITPARPAQTQATRGRGNRTERRLGRSRRRTEEGARPIRPRRAGPRPGGGHGRTTPPCPATAMALSCGHTGSSGSSSGCSRPHWRPWSGYLTRPVAWPQGVSDSSGARRARSPSSSDRDWR
jgi:hypothetical protein